MNGQQVPARRQSLFVITASLLLAGLIAVPGLIAAPGTARAETRAPVPTAAVAKVLEQERARLGKGRLSELAKGGAAGAPRVATRNVDPGSARALAGAAGKSSLSFAALDALPETTGGKDWECLAEAIYFESRGEPLSGQIAVAEVILNRVDSPAYPKTVCGVTRQGVGTAGRACQFSYACDGRSDVMNSAQPRDRARKLATLMLAGRERTVTDGATHFHTTAVRPSWSRKLTRVAKVGHHVFYRAGGTRVASN